MNKSHRFQPAFLKTATQTFEAGNFLQVFIRFWGFWDWFSYKNILMKKSVYFFNQTVCKQGSRTQFQLSWKVESVKNWKKELYITHCRGSAPTPGACTLVVCIKHADDSEKNSIFIHRCYLWAGQYRTEHVIHDINITFLQLFYFLD